MMHHYGYVEVNRGAVRPGMLVKHKDGMWTACGRHQPTNAESSIFTAAVSAPSPEIFWLRYILMAAAAD